MLQGHFQIVLDTDRCPLFLSGLSWFQRIMYCSGVWAYVVGALSTPFFIAVPLVTIWAGIFPIIVSWWAAREYPTLLLHHTAACLYALKAACLHH